MPIGDDERPFWQRLYGVGASWNPRALDRFARFLVAALLVVAVLFGVVVLAAWLS